MEPRVPGLSERYLTVLEGGVIFLLGEAVSSTVFALDPGFVVGSKIQTLVRIIVPGMMMIVIFRSLKNPEMAPWDFELVPDSKSALFLLAFVLGYFYHASDIRKTLSLRWYWHRTDNFIRDKLVSLAESDGIANANELPLRSIMQVFWNLVDNDKTLSYRSQMLRLNGIFVSSAADLTIFSSVCALCHLACIFLSQTKSPRVIWFVTSLCAAIISQWLIVPWLISRHFRLQDDQLLYVETHKREEVRSQLANLV